MLYLLCVLRLLLRNEPERRWSFTVIANKINLFAPSSFVHALNWYLRFFPFPIIFENLSVVLSWSRRIAHCATAYVTENETYLICICCTEKSFTGITKAIDKKMHIGNILSKRNLERKWQFVMRPSLSYSECLLLLKENIAESSQ